MTEDIREGTLPIETVLHWLETINTYLVVYEDQEAWAYTQVLLKGIKSGEL